MSSYRISKVLSELNIGLDTAVDYLKSKGHEVEKNRNAKIDQAQYDLLLESFASDKTSKDKAETLIQQKREEKEAIQAERIEAEKVKPEVIRGTAKLDGPKISGKIDLAPKAKAAAVAPAEVKPAQAVPASEKVVPPPVVEAPEVKESPAPPKEESSVSDAPVKPEAKEPIAPAELPVEVVSPDGTHTTQYQKLDGPKLTGQTIDLAQFAKKPKAEGDAGKRKRIKTEGLQKPAAGGGRTTTGAASVGGPRRDNTRPGLGAHRGAPAAAPKEVSKEDIERKIKETLEKLGGGRKSKGSKMRRDKRAERTERREMAELERIEGEKTLKL
ncbi:MAG: translation initiation factor IF-2, partial [Bacteroidetes bacterium]|nr:translation initiation factor IF-2 [Bacteroidota bacterium]